MGHFKAIFTVAIFCGLSLNVHADKDSDASVPKESKKDNKSSDPDVKKDKEASASLFEQAEGALERAENVIDALQTAYALYEQAKKIADEIRRKTRRGTPLRLERSNIAMLRDGSVFGIVHIKAMTALAGAKDYYLTAENSADAARLEQFMLADAAGLKKLEYIADADRFKKADDLEKTGFKKNLGQHHIIITGNDKKITFEIKDMSTSFNIDLSQIYDYIDEIMAAGKDTKKIAQINEDYADAVVPGTHWFKAYADQGDSTVYLYVPSIIANRLAAQNK